MTPVALVAASATSELPAQIGTIIVGFALVVWILKAFAWKPVLSVLDERRKTVSDRFEDIDRRMNEASRLLKEYEEKLRHIDDEARERHNKAVDEGRRMATELIEKSRKESEEITAKAQAQMAMELDKARIELRRDVVEMTLAATGRLLQANLDEARQRELVDSFIQDIGEHNAS